jgi:hypothetical protein
MYGLKLVQDIYSGGVKLSKAIILSHTYITSELQDWSSWRLAKLRGIRRHWTHTLLAVQLLTTLLGAVEGKSNFKRIWKVTLHRIKHQVESDAPNKVWLFEHGAMTLGIGWSKSSTLQTRFLAAVWNMSRIRQDKIPSLFRVINNIADIFPHVKNSK